MCVHSLLLLLTITSLGVDGGVPEAGQEGGVAPEIVEEPSEEIVRRNDPLTLYCKASGAPQPRILWYRTDSEVPLRDRDSRLQLPDGSLFFYRVRGRDRGTYYCVARSPAGTATSRRVNVQMAYLRETFRRSPSSLGVKEGETAVFECEPPKGHPTPVVTWRLDRQALVLPRHRYRQEGPTLVVSHVIPSDEGEYQCVVTNMAGQRTSKPALLTVFESARVGGVVKSMVGVAGHPVTLPCSPTGTPEPQVLWRRADGLMPVGRASVGRDWSLTISSVSTSDQGIYVCEASNSAGAHSANTTLLVVERPRVEGGARPRIAVITPTHVRKISCPVTATPTPIVFWARETHDRHEALRVVGGPHTGGEESQQVAPEGPQVVVYDSTDGGGGAGGVRVDSEHSLHVTPHHEGLWACIAANEVGGLLVPVRVVGGGVAHGTVGVGVVGVDEVEARASLLTPTLEQGYPTHASPTATTVTWRLTGRATQRLEGIYILGCERGRGLISPRIQQQLQALDISINHNQHHNHHFKWHSSLLQQTAGSSTPSTVDHLGGSRSSRADVVSRTPTENSTMIKQREKEEEEVEEEEEEVEEKEEASERFFFRNASPRCSELRVLGHTSFPGRLSYQLQGLRPYTSYWLLLLPHYKGVLGVPSNIQPFTTLQDVPSGWAVLSRWWAARAGAGLYALTLHWTHPPAHLLHGVLHKYLVTVKESDTGVTHNVTVLGHLTSLTLPNVTSSRVEVILTASTIKGPGPPSPPARLNLLRTHLKDPGVGVGVVRSAWFLVLAGGAVAMLVMVVGCTLAARWCTTGMRHSLSSEVTKGKKVCGVGGPWVDVGSLWAPVPSHDLSSDKSDRKLLASNGSSSAAGYVEVEAVGSQLKDDVGSKTRLRDSWRPGFLCTTPSSSLGSSQRNKHLVQTESLPARSEKAQSSPASVIRRHTGNCYTTSAARTSSSSWRDSDTSTWYTGDYCSCCRDDVNLPPAQESFSGPSSGCSTVLHLNPGRGDLQVYSPSVEYQYSGLSTDVYEVVNAYEEASVPKQSVKHRPRLSSRRDLQHLTLNTESATDLSISCYDDDDEEEDDDNDITQSCSDTEASFFIPHERKRQSSGEGNSKENGSLSFDIQRSTCSVIRSNHVPEEDDYRREIQKLVKEGQSQRDVHSLTNTLKYPDQNMELSSTSNTSTLNTAAVDDLETSSTRRASCRSSISQDSLEEQFERTLSMITHGGSVSLDSDYPTTSAYN